MTTRRWMLVVAILAVGLGGYLEGSRLIERRRELLKIAARHAAEASRFRKLAAPARLVGVRERLERALASLDENEPDADTEFRALTQQMMGIAQGEAAGAPIKEDYSFEAARDRQRALLVQRYKLELDGLVRHAKHFARCAGHHAALSAKYAAAADRPWRHVAPDPPDPE
jgi:hypothetical protein